MCLKKYFNTNRFALTFLIVFLVPLFVFAVLGVVTTDAPYSILSQSAVAGITISSTGGVSASVGIIYGFDATFTTQVIATSTLAIISGSGSSASVLSGLHASTTYYVRAFITNPSGTAYGVTRSFTTLKSAAPYLTTSNESSLTHAAATLNGTLFSNSGNYWEDTGSVSSAWFDVASSADGLKLVGVIYDYYIYTSSDGGETWTTRLYDLNRSWVAVAISADGSKLAAVQYSGNIFTSTDGGVNWTEQTNSGARAWSSVSISSDGLTIVATAGGDGLCLIACNTNDYIYVSTDGGVNWTARSDSTPWIDVASSANGQILIAASADGYVYTSSNSGTTWTPNAELGLNTWETVDISSDGTKMVVAGNTTSIYTSTNSGTSWTERNALGGSYWWNDSAISDDGQTIIISDVNFSKVFASNDGGASWFEYEYFASYAARYFNFWTGFAMKSDGSKIFVAPTEGRILKSTVYTDPTIRGFVYGTTASYGATTTESGSFVSGGFSSALSGLSCETTYYYKSYATNEWGVGYSLSGDTFTTSACPVYSIPALTTDAVSSVATSTATLNATVTAYGEVDATQHGFAYGTSSTLATVIATSTLGSLSGNTTFTSNISSLSPNTTYYFRSYSTNTEGTGYGSIVSFTTDVAIPTLTTDTVSSTATSTATLNGTVTAYGGVDATQHGFAYGTSSTLATVIATSTLGSLAGNTSFTRNITGLSNNTTYYVRAYSTNTEGTGYGSIVSFTTDVATPIVSTDTASSLSTTGATLNGTVSNAGGATITIRGFAYGPTTTYTSTTTDTGSYSAEAFTSSITGLSCATTYHVRAYATNATSTGYGDDATFITSSCPITTSINNGPVFTGSASFLPGYVKPRMQTIYPDGRVVYHDENKNEEQKNVSLPLLQTEIISTKPSSVLRKIGNEGKDIIELQKFLNKSGFIVSIKGPGSPQNESNYFGRKTFEALKKYQKSVGLPAFGLFGPMTREKMGLK